MTKYLISSEEQQLVLDNIRLVHHLAKKLQFPYNDYDDIISVGTLGLIKAAQTFDKSKNIQFSTYASRCITNEFFLYFRREKKHENDISLDVPCFTTYDGDELLLGETLPVSDKEFTQEYEDSETLLFILSIILNYLTVKEMLVILYDIAGVTQRDIATNLNLSQSYVSREEKKCYKKIKNAFTFNKKFVNFFSISMVENLYIIRFPLEKVESFNKIFSDNIQNILSERPDFKLVYTSKYVFISVPAEFESFSFIADIIKELDKNNLLPADIPISNSTVVNKEKNNRKKQEKNQL